MAHSYMDCEKHGLYLEDVGCMKCEEEARARYRCELCGALFETDGEAADHERLLSHRCVIFHAMPTGRRSIGEPQIQELPHPTPEARAIKDAFLREQIKQAMHPGRSLQCGDWATTDYNGEGTCTRVQILEVCANGERGHSQSGIMFRVAGERGQRVMRNEGPDSWYDADWFTPEERL